MVSEANFPRLQVLLRFFNFPTILEKPRIDSLSIKFWRFFLQLIPQHLINNIIFYIDPVGEEWSDRASDCFEELTHVAQWKKLSARMNGYCVREKTRAKRAGSPVPGVELFCVNNGEDVDVADELVRNGLAQYRTEPERSSPSMGSSRSGSNDVDVAPPEW